MDEFLIENSILKKYRGKDEILVIPEGITKICSGFICFKDCVKEIVFPESLKELEDEACLEVYNLKKIFIPKNVNKIGSNICGKCYALEEIVVDSNNKTYGSYHSNCIVDIKKQRLIQGCFKTTIPPIVKEISERSFWKHHRLTGIEIPNGVISIQKEAFYGTKLNEIVLPSSIQFIHPTALFACYELEKIAVDTQNDWYCDLNCNSLVRKRDMSLMVTGTEGNVPPSVKKIGTMDEEDIEERDNVTFMNVSEGKTIQIPMSVDFIANRAFDGLRNIRIQYSGSEEEWYKLFQHLPPKLCNSCALILGK